MKKMFFDLLREWCDALISLQFRGTGDVTLDGGFHCRACHVLHGRAADAVYPFMVMAKHTGDEKYIDAAKSVFDFGENFVCDDGAVLNDGQSMWKGITVFAAVAICEALNAGGDMLDDVIREKWEKRVYNMGKWLYVNLDERMNANINYTATNCLALALLGKYFGCNEYLAKASHLAEYVMTQVTENGFLYGEGSFRDNPTPLGCRSVDIGYNMEESIPSLIKYAYEVGNEEMLDSLADILLKQLDFMLPDGAWDNSFGTRNNKWTYWGSRTSDGCASAFILLAKRNPLFAEAAYRNTELIRSCTYGGLIHGGPHYFRRGQNPCTHHTFEHANAIAFALEHLENDTYDRLPLPCDNAESFRYYPEINTYKIASGDYRATVTGYDADVKRGGHVSGGTLTLLWKYGRGPMIAASVADYVLVEPQNMQLTRDSNHRALVPRLVCNIDGVIYSTAYFTSPRLSSEQKNGEITVNAVSGLCDSTLLRMREDVDRLCSYTLSPEGMRISISSVGDARMILPLIDGTICLMCGTIESKKGIFFLTGGFEATEYIIAPDKNGRIELILK